MLRDLVASPRAASVPGWRRLLGPLRQGLTTYSAAAAAHQQRALVTALRRRQIRPRRVAVIGGHGGAGTTTTAVLLASVLAATRDDQTLLLTVHSDAADVAARLGVQQAPSVTEVLAGLHRHGRIPPTPLTRTGLRVLAAPSPGAPAVDAGLAALLEVAASGHTSVVADAGVANRIGDLGRVAELFDTVVLVCRTSADAISATAAVSARWQAQLPAQASSRLILVPVGARGARGRDQDQVERVSVDIATTRPVAHDPELARGRPVDLSLVSGPTLTAALTLGADIMGHR